MPNEWFDKSLEDRFNGMPADLDLESAWTSLEQKRNKKNRKGFILFFFGLGSIVLVGMVFYPLLKETQSGSVMYPNENPVTIDQTTLPIATDTAELKKEIPVISEEIINSQAQVESQTITIPSPAESMYVQDEVDVLYEPKVFLEKPIASPLSISIHDSGFNSLKTKSFLVSYSGKGIPSTNPIPFLKEEKELQSKRSIFLAGQYGLTGWNRTPENQSALIDLKEETVDRISGGIYFRQDLFSRLFLETGIEYAQISNHSTATQSLTTQESQDGFLIEIRFLQDGSIEEVYGNSEVNVLETTTYSLWELHQSLTLPVEIGWHVLQNEKVEFNVHAGIGVEMSLNRSGLRWGFKGEGSKTTQLSSLPFRNQGLIQLRGGADLSYNFNQRTSLIFGVGAGHDLVNQLSSSEQGAEQYSWLHGRLGIQFQL